MSLALIQDSQRLPRVPLPRIVQQLVTNPVDSSGRLDFGTDDLEVARLFLGHLSAGSGVLLRGTSGSRMIYLLLLMFLDCFVEMLYN